MMDEKHFLIVGGSSGIGLEIVKALHEKGNEVYVGSRTNDQLAEPTRLGCSNVSS